MSSKKLGLYKTGNNQFIPAYDEDYEFAQKLKQGQIHYFTIKKVRNPLFHRLFFKLLTIGYENQDRYNNFEHYRGVVTVKAGYYHESITSEGIIKTPMSIAYDNMDELQFREVFERVMDVVTKDIGVPPDTLMKEVKA